MTVHVSDNERKSVPYFALQQMADLVKSMMHDALDSFARMNIDEITRIIGLDDRVDREYGSSIKQLISQMMEDPRNIARTLNVLSTASALEKIGDYVCYICHHVIYMIKGEDVRHLTQQELELRMNQLICN
jgi:phosphate transport system protein